jgi:hypothetical protein
MNEKELDTRFQEAVDIAFKMTKHLYQDVQLRLMLTGYFWHFRT